MYGRTKWEQLPTEILELIFSMMNDEKSSFLEYQLVNKHWYKTTQRVFYRHLQVSYDPFEHGLSRSGMTPYTRIQHLLNDASFDVGSRVKKISFSFEDACKDTDMKFWETLIIKCPYVKQVRCYFVLTSELYNELALFLNEDSNRWKYLERFEAGVITEQDEKNHANFLCQIGSTRLKRIELSHLPDMFNRNLTKYLKLFNNLTQLKMFVKESLLNNLFDLEQLFDATPKLEELDIHWTSRPDDENEVDTTSPTLYLGSSEKCKPILTMRNLLVESYTSSYPKHELEFIMKKFPNLQKITFEASVVHHIESGEQVALTAAIEDMIGFTCSIKCYCFSLRHQFDIMLAKHYFDVFSNASKGKPGLEIAFLKQNKPQELSILKHGVKSMPWMKIEIEKDALHSQTFDTFMGMIGSNLNTLMLRSSSQNNDYVLGLLGYAFVSISSFSLPTFEYPLAAVLSKCSLLKELIISHGDFEAYDEKTMMELHSNSLEKFVIDHSTVPNHFFTLLSTKACFPKLKNLFIRGCGFFSLSQETLNIPEADLDTLSLLKSKSFEDLCERMFEDEKKEVNVKITTTLDDQDRYYYYCSDFRKKQLVLTNKQEYTFSSSIESRYTLHIVCKSIQKLEVDTALGTISLDTQQE
ncbi:uncharacterized protein B0P05DRAFT_366652 [Gilbertella persicaria]|uniref:uncharacterized protein n=1 Tax=Gilbertella persicaria TaxID=101096 RepID=UPI00221FFAE6|nr:uncharacterized protein B0P05DRAFT_366652 [Gilbertella persicaria]KAI8047250.1 hypothetical protein B0P05DRAFT_366652 [Gilbertella persicaria]